MAVDLIHVSKTKTTAAHEEIRDSEFLLLFG